VAWEKTQKKRLLPVPYFHIVFTLPDELRAIVRKNQKCLLPLLSRAAADTLKTLLADKKWLGGKIGILIVLHTFTQQLLYHPHVHCLLPALALTDDDRIILADRTFLLPEAVLATFFRGRLMTLYKRALPQMDWPQGVWHKPWVVNCRPTRFATEKLIDYLGRYLKRTAITDARILGVTDTSVTFRYQDRRTQTRKVITLAPFDFLSRFLQHVLPRGMHKVRAYGLLSPSYRHTLADLKKRLSAQQKIIHPSDSPDVADAADPAVSGLSNEPQFPLLPPFATYRCPYCHARTVIRIGPYAPRSRGPPWLPTPLA
jgi:hypothetical protein